METKNTDLTKTNVAPVPDKATVPAEPATSLSTLKGAEVGMGLLSDDERNKLCNTWYEEQD